jgi:hypothetical protein
MKNLTKFYEFSQNNSGGHFDVDENVCHRVIIEATSERHAKSILEPFIEDQSSSCSCCGERWSGFFDNEVDIEQYREGGYSASVHDSEEKWFALYGEFPIHTEPEWNNKYGFKEFEGSVYFETIEQYAQFSANRWGSTTPDVIIHYLDGTKKKFFKKD